MAYAEVSDLMLGDLALGSVDSSKYIQEATEDVDIALSRIYQMPYDVDDPGANENTVILLRRITARLASGRLILAQSIGGEDDRLQAYGQHLIEEAETVIDAILTGRLQLEGPPPVEGADLYAGPRVDNYDSASAVDSFYGEYMTPVSRPVPRTGPVWQPGG